MILDPLILVLSIKSHKINWKLIWNSKIDKKMHYFWSKISQHTENLIQIYIVSKSLSLSNLKSILEQKVWSKDHLRLKLSIRNWFTTKSFTTNRKIDDLISVIDFKAWLISNLRLKNYSVWIQLNKLKSKLSFWKNAINFKPMKSRNVKIKFWTQLLLRTVSFLNKQKKNTHLLK